jgi:hypothetical protein
MTVHDQHDDLDRRTENADLPTESVVHVNDQSTERRDVDGGGLHQADFQPTDQANFQPTEPARSTSAAPPETSTGQALFADHELSDMQSRWAEVQAAFVDDPKDSVQRADGLVTDVVDQITSSLSQARSQLEEQWARGEDASTEDLRVALTRYREFFQRLLTV